MVRTIVLTLGNSANSLIDAAYRIIGKSDLVSGYCVDWDEDLDHARDRLGQKIGAIAKEDGILLLTDMFGGTSTNIALSFHQPARVEIVTGVNLPMIIKALTLPRGISVNDAAVLLKNQARKAINVASEML